MQQLGKLFKFYIFSSLHVSLVAFSLTKITLLTYDIHENSTPLFTFVATLVSYNFIKYYKTYDIDLIFVKWINRHDISLLVLNMVSLTLLITLFIQLKMKAILTLLPFILITFFYVVPLHFSKKNLRSISSLKIFLITISWAVITVIFPLVQNDIVFSKNIEIILVQRFLFIFAITIPFDIRDYNYDKPEIKTLPQLIGINASKLIGIITLVLFFLLDYSKISAIKNTVFLTGIVAAISIVFVLFARKYQSKYYSSFWVEAIPIFWLAILLLFGA